MNFKEQYFDVWQEAWRFHKQFVNMDGTDEDWQRAVDTSGAIVEKYRDRQEYDFMKDLILAIISEIERVDKHKRKESKKVG